MVIRIEAGSIYRAVRPFVVCGAAILSVHFPSLGQTPPRITSIDDSVRVQVRQTVHPMVQVATDLGPLDSESRMERMLLVLGPSDDVQLPLRTLLDGLQDKRSPNYHAWLTPEQFAARFGPSEGDVNQIAAWLQSSGFDHITPARGRTNIEFCGSASAVEQAFGTRMHAYRLGTRTYVANATDISLPQALIGVVRGVLLESFSFSQPALAGGFEVQRDASGNLVPVSPQFTSFDSQHFLAPADFSAIYDLNPLFSQGMNGKGRTVAIVARSNISLVDVELFRQIFNLPPNDPNIILNGPDPGFDGGNDAVEASLDSQWIGATAPGATVDVVVSESTATTDGVLLSSAYIVDNNLADVMSVSFLACEQTAGAQNAFFNSLWQQAAAEGISVFVAAGDTGAAGCDTQGFSATAAKGGLAVNGLASTPYDTAVGGTEFLDDNSSLFWNSDNGPAALSALGYIPEEIWNEGCSPDQVGTICAAVDAFQLLGGGGGTSTLYSKPSWQSTTLLGVPNDQMRDLPDVSLSASVHDSYLICVSGIMPCVATGSGNQLTLVSAGSVGGTSASSPSFAGIMALVDQARGERQGLANYVLYKLAANETFANCNSSARTNPATPPSAACVFNDVTQGNNGIPGNDVSNVPTPGALGYPATPGYDLGSGLGSVNAASLVSTWKSAIFQGSTTALAANNSTFVPHGQPMGFSVKVSALGNNGVPTGGISLIAVNPNSPFTGGTALAAGTLTNGAISFSVDSLPGGQYNVIARYPGDGNFGGSDSNPVQVAVSPENSVTTIRAFAQSRSLLPSPVSSAYGTFFALDVTVAPASGNGVATGIVTFSDAGVPIAQVSLNSSGQAELFNCTPLFCLSIGSHTITASYSGDSSLNASVSSSPFVFNITKGSPLLLLNALGFSPAGNPPGSLVIEQFSVNFAQIGNTPPSGTITFFESSNGTNTATLGPIQLAANGTIPVQSLSLPVGNNGVSAQYSGDSNYLPATSETLPENVTANGKVSTQVTLSAPAQTYAVGQAVTFTVNVTSSQQNPIPTGQVSLFGNDQFIIGGTLGSTSLTNGSATIHAILPSAPSMLRALYTGDSNFAPSLSSPISVSVAKATPTLTLSSNLQTVHLNQQVTLLATIAPPTGAFSPGGTVQFFDAFNGGQPVPFAPAQALPPSLGFASPGTPAVLAVPAFLQPAGTHVFTASYSGDNNYNSIAVSASSVTVKVTGGTSPQTIVFPPLANPLTFGVAPIALTAKASSGLPISYSVTGPASLSNFVLTIARTGSVIITANQPGNGEFAAAPSVSQTITVLKAKTVTGLASSSLSAVAGLPITLTASITSAASVTPTGSVQFQDGQTILSTVPLNAQGSAAFTTSSLATGSHTIAAAYQGDEDFSASTSAALTQAITDFSVSANVPALTLAPGQTQKFTVTITPVNGFNSAVSLSCGAQSLVSCAFMPQSVTPNGGAVSSALMVTASASRNASSGPHSWNSPRSTLVAAALIFLLVLVSLRVASADQKKKPRMKPAMAIGFVCLLIGLLANCGGGSSSPPQSGTVVISASTAGSAVRTTSFNVTVTF